MKRDKLKQYDENPIFLPLMTTIPYMPRYPYFVTGWGHCKIEPKTKHLSHSKKNQYSWQTKPIIQIEIQRYLIMHKRIQKILK